MSRFDLSDAQDFKTLTLGGAGNVLQTLSLIGRDPNKWDLQEASYNGVPFHVFQSKTQYQAELSNVQDNGGRRLVKYKYPYKDGQTTDDLGREAETFEMQALIHGPRYMQGFALLKAELDKSTPGDLVHPVRGGTGGNFGKIRCKVESYQIVHNYNNRFAMELRLTFTEHNFTIGDIRLQKDNSVKNFLAKALDVLGSIDNAITNILGIALLARSVKNQIVQGITDYKNRFGTSLTKMNTVFNNGSSDDIPGLLPVNEGGLRNPDGTTISNIFPVASSQNDALTNLGINTTQSFLSVTAEQITKEIIKIRQDLDVIIELMKSSINGRGSLFMHDEILTLINSAITLQNTLEAGIASSRAQVIDYLVPREMSIREVAFANGLIIDRVSELYQLNLKIESFNSIAKGDTVRVPLS